MTMLLALAFVLGAVVALLLGAALLVDVRRREEATVRLLSSLHAGFTEAAASGAWPIALKLPGSRGDSGELMAWHLLEATPTVIASSTGAALALHYELLQRALGSRTAFFQARLADAAGGAAHGLGAVIDQQGKPAMVLTCIRRRGFTERELNWAAAFGRLTGNSLEVVLAQRRSAVIGQLIDAVEAAESASNVIDIALHKLSSEMGGMIAGLLRYEKGQFRPYGVTGETSPELRSFFTSGFAAENGVAMHVYRTGEPVYMEEYGEHPNAVPEVVALGVRPVAIVPLEARTGSRMMLAFAGEKARPWHAHERDLIEGVRQVLRVVLQLRVSEERLDAVVQLERELVTADTASLPERLLEAAVDMVPGAEAGSLLIREGDGFHYAAISGYDAPELFDVALSERDLLRWYAADPANFARGEPRLAEAASDQTLFSTIGDHPSATWSEKVTPALANLCVPVVDVSGAVVALLNLDSLTDRDAFGPEALDVANAFQPLIGFVLRDAELRQHLAASATTDALTDLPNRRAFDEEAERAVANAKRYGDRLALLVMDMRGFKGINDSYGHAVGDAVLKQVAAALSSVPRVGDTVYRWGGDEFAALLSNVDRQEAFIVAERFAEVVSEVGGPGQVVEVDGAAEPGAGISTDEAAGPGEALAINIGVAIYPDDADTLERLLATADWRMYQAKLGGSTVVGVGRPPTGHGPREAQTEPRNK